MILEEQDLIAVFRKCGGHAARGRVTFVEFKHRVFDEFASLNRVSPAIIPTLWDLVPETIREEFTAAIRSATAPEFRYAFLFGELTDEALRRRNADLRTARVQAWAVEFVRFLDGVAG